MPTDQEHHDYIELLERHESLIDQLAAAGWTASEAYHRIALVNPTINRNQLTRAIHSGRWTFASAREETLNNVLMASALWYAVAHAYDLAPDYEYAALRLDPVVVQDLPRMLETFDVAPQHTANIIGRIGAALRYLAELPYTQLEETAYDYILANLPEEVRGISRDSFSWPPPRDIIEDRLGDRSWADALLKVGICPPDPDSLGISLNPASLSERTFRNALGEFLSYCIRYDRKPSVLLYGSWAANHQPASGTTPYLGLVRAKYGSWDKALKVGRQLVNDALRVQETAAFPARRQTQGATKALTLDDITAQGIGVVRSSPSKETVIDPWEGLHSVFVQRLDELPWSRSLRIYYVTPLALETKDYTSHAHVLRSPAGYFCELTSPTEFKSVEVTLDTDLLTEQGWVSPAAGGRWTKNFLSVAEAATGIMDAMRYGLGCVQPDYYQSDSFATPAAGEVASPNTGAVPMIPVENQSITSIEDFD